MILNIRCKSNKLADELASANTTLDNLIYNEVKGAALRSRTSWYEERDKASKMFLNLEKAQSERKYINKLRTEDGRVLTNTKDILKERNPTNKSYTPAAKNRPKPI